jgi:CRISPR/Cas system CSM-associated protein Csm2 small subunit
MSILENYARQILRDVKMRKALLEFLQEATKEMCPGDSSIEPMRDDDETKEELRRILGIRKGWLK